MSRDIVKCPECGAKVYHFYSAEFMIDYALCSRNSSIRTAEDGTVSQRVFEDPNDGTTFHCWGIDY